MEAVEESFIQQDSEGDLVATLEDAFNPAYAARKSAEKGKSLKERASVRGGEQAEEKKGILSAESADEKAKDLAQEFQRHNPDLKEKGLLNLRDMLKNCKTPEEALETAAKAYHEAFLQDEALRFVEASIDPESELYQTLHEARDQLYNEKGAEIRAGRNINADALKFALNGLGKPEAMRQLYLEIVNNPREPVDLFNHLSQMVAQNAPPGQAFPLKQLKAITDFVFHALGTDMKSAGPSVEQALLLRLFNGARTMQALTGLFHHFEKRDAYLHAEFARYGLPFPKELSYDRLAAVFVDLLMERYPTPAGVLKMADRLKLQSLLLAQAIVFNLLRDAVRNVSPRLYRNKKHYEDMLAALMETVEELERELEKLYEDQDPKEKKKK